MNSTRIAHHHGYGTALLLLYTLLIAPTAFGQSVRALNSSSTFHIAPQPLPTALLQYTEQSGVHVTSSAALLEHRESAGVVGRMDARTALTKILEGTTLGFESIDESAVVILPARATLDPRPGEKRAVSTKDRRSAEADEVVVTGSHIRGTQRNGYQVYSFDRADIAATGVGSIQEFMRFVPQNLSGGRSEASSALRSFRNSGQDNIGDGAGINLRGLGNEATLVLIDGQRMGPSGVGGFHDVSTLPLNAIERIDVLPDGMSAIYGSDAIAGVVNIILRENTDQAETELRYGDVSDGDAHEFAAGQVIGASWQSGSMLLTGDYRERGPLFATDREYAKDLWLGRNNLLPEEQRLSALLRAHQSLASSIRASIDFYASDRDVMNGQYNRTVAAQLISRSKTEFVGGTAKIDWTSMNGWDVAFAYTYSQTQNGQQTATYWRDTLRTGFATELGISATELKAHGPAFHSPAGLAELALGAERRYESMRLRRHPNLTAAAPTSSNHRSVDAAYAELELPLMARGDPSQKAVLAMNAAVRYENASDVRDTRNVKIGATWSPLMEVDLHTSWGTSSRVPFLWQFDSSGSQGILTYVPNPASPSGRTRIGIAYLGPHPRLGPESARTWTAGFSISPSLPGDIRVSGTYFDIDYRHRIVAPVLSTNLFRDPQQSALVSSPPDPEVMDWIRAAPIFGNPYSIDLADVEATVDGRTNSQGSAKVSGVDLIATGHAQSRFGTLSGSLNVNYFTRFDTRVNRSVSYMNVLDTLSNPVDFRGRAQTMWSNGAWSVSAAVNYVDDYVDNQRSQTRRIASWTTIDLGTTYSSGNTGWLRDLTLHANVVNIANKAPPRVYDLMGAYGDPGYDPASANPLGRFISLQITKTW